MAYSKENRSLNRFPPLIQVRSSIGRHVGPLCFVLGWQVALGALRARGVPIFAFTDVESAFRQLTLPWGVEPFKINFSDDPEKTILSAMSFLKDRDWCAAGTWLVVITNALASSKVIDTLQLRQID